MQKIKEVIVVEGKHDSERLKKIYDCQTIETSGTHLGKETIKLIKEAQEKCGVIVFCDPDHPGELIRKKISEEVPNVKHAFIARNKAKTKHKVGVEHASSEDLIEALNHLVSFEENKQTLSYEEFLQLGLNGKENSSDLRKYLGNKLFIGGVNAKTLFKRLNMLGYTYENILEIIKEYYG